MNAISPWGRRDEMWDKHTSIKGTASRCDPPLAGRGRAQERHLSSKARSLFMPMPRSSPPAAPPRMPSHFSSRGTSIWFSKIKRIRLNGSKCNGRLPLTLVELNRHLHSTSRQLEGTRSIASSSNSAIIETNSFRLILRAKHMMSVPNYVNGAYKWVQMETTISQV